MENSILADRFLELTNTIEKKNMHDQYLDTMGLNRNEELLSNYNL